MNATKTGSIIMCSGRVSMICSACSTHHTASGMLWDTSNSLCWESHCTHYRHNSSKWLETLIQQKNKIWPKWLIFQTKIKKYIYVSLYVWKNILMHMYYIFLIDIYFVYVQDRLTTDRLTTTQEQLDEITTKGEKVGIVHIFIWRIILMNLTKLKSLKLIILEYKS